MTFEGPPGPKAETPPGVADVLGGFCQQDAPPGGYTLDGFDRRIAKLEETQQHLEDTDDHRGVFHLTYLAFSRQVRKAFDGDRFADPAFAADMSCRFVDAYLEQARRWEANDPTQCRAWRTAFGGAESGDANVLQSMFLGMNAHIHYDLAFVTLGSCRAFGDLDRSGGEASLSMSGVPDSRHVDFLVINQIGWESIPIIQDAVLGSFAAPLKWGNKLVGGVTSSLGQRLLMGARDTAWAQANLLVHARDQQRRAAVAAIIDAYAASHTHLVEVLSANPVSVVRGVRSWRNRRDAQAWGDGVVVPDATCDALLDLALNDPVVAALALRQVAFAGYDPARVLDALVGAARADLAGEFVVMVRRHAPADRQGDLEHYLGQTGDRTQAVVEAVVADAHMPLDELPDDSVDLLAGKWRRSIHDAARCLTLPNVAAVGPLAEALTSYRNRTIELLDRIGCRVESDDSGPPLTEPQADALLAVHPDSWVRLCGTLVGTGGDENMSEMIDRVLFLKTTPVFMEVEAGALLAVAEELQPKAFDPGEEIIMAGQPSHGIHLVVDGMVAVVQDHNGAPVKVADVGPGGGLGELSALNDSPARSTCHAVVATETLFLPVAVLARLLHQHPRVAVGLLRHLGQRLEDTTQMVLNQRYGS